MTKDPNTIPHGFILSESAIYSFLDQDVFPDLISFCAAIPDHLKPLFLIPIRLDPVAAPQASTASIIIASRIADGPILDGDSPEAELFGTKTFVYDDNEPTIPSSDPGSIFDIDGADALTHHQDLEENQDQNIQVPSDTSYMSDVDVTDSGFNYPYRAPERPLRHSVLIASFSLVRVAIKPNELETKAPKKIRENARVCTVSMVSYDKRGRVFTFDVNCGNGAKTVRASLTDINNIAMSCTCPFWQWNGPEFHAKTNDFMLGIPRGTAGPPDIRDPERKYYLCKHAFAVLRRLDEFVGQVVDDNWGLEEADLVEKVDENWDKMAEVAEVPIDDFQEEPPADWEEPGEEDEVIDDTEIEDLSGEEIESDESEEVESDDEEELDELDELEFDDEEEELESEEESEPEPEPESGKKELDEEDDEESESEEPDDKEKR